MGGLGVDRHITIGVYGLAKYKSFRGEDVPRRRFVAHTIFLAQIEIYSEPAMSRPQ
jgi:hypothetical protein